MLLWPFKVFFVLMINMMLLFSFYMLLLPAIILVGLLSGS